MRLGDWLRKTPRAGVERDTAGTCRTALGPRGGGPDAWRPCERLSSVDDERDTCALRLRAAPAATGLRPAQGITRSTGRAGASASASESALLTRENASCVLHASSITDATLHARRQSVARTFSRAPRSSAQRRVTCAPTHRRLRSELWRRERRKNRGRRRDGAPLFLLLLLLLHDRTLRASKT